MDRDRPDSDSDSDSDSDDTDDNYVTPAAEGSYMNSCGLRRSNRERTQPIYIKVTNTSKKYAEAPKGKEGPMDSYRSFLNEGVLSMNAGDTEDYKMTDDEVNHHIIGVDMAQHFSLKAGLKKFEVPGEEATTKELVQLHDMVTFISMDPAKLNRADRLKALSSLIFLIEKRYGTHKARACADGNK